MERLSLHRSILSFSVFNLSNVSFATFLTFATFLWQHVLVAALVEKEPLREQLDVVLGRADGVQHRRHRQLDGDESHLEQLRHLFGRGQRRGQQLQLADLLVRALRVDVAVALREHRVDRLGHLRRARAQEF